MCYKYYENIIFSTYNISELYLFTKHYYTQPMATAAEAYSNKKKSNNKLLLFSKRKAK